MFFTLLFFAFAIPLSYFRSEKARAWNPPSFSFFEGGYHLEEPLVSFPVVPFWSFGFRFDGDLMISLADDEPWGMIEVAYVENKDGEKVWFTLDSRLDGQQYIGLSDHPLARDIAALFPVPSYQAHLEVAESADAYVVSYMRGNEPISFSIAREDTVYPPSARNGHAMNHSQRDMMAILNISSLKLRPVQWVQNKRRVQSILWQPISGVMSQTVAGMRRGTWTQTQNNLHNTLSESDAMDNQECIHASHSRYCFHVKGKEKQLSSITLFQPLHKESISSIRFSPALPDLRFLPKHTHCSDLFWEIDQQEHLQAQACIHPLRYGNSMVVSVHASKPSWVNARPIMTSLTFHQQKDEVDVHSAVLSEGADEEHTQKLSPANVVDISIPNAFQWNGTQLIPQGRTEKNKVQVYSVGIPLVPKDGLLVGKVEVDSSFIHPFLLRLKGHLLPEIQELSFHLESRDGSNYITLTMKPSKRIDHGAWVEIDVGSLVSSNTMHALSLKGSSGGMELQKPLFLKDFHIRAKTCSFALNGTMSAKPKECLGEISMFWSE